MDESFDEAYAKYRSFLAKLDQTDDVSEKNLLFRELAEQLSEMEQKLRRNKGVALNPEPATEEESELTYWI